MSIRSELMGPIKQLARQDADILQLKYVGGHTYEEIGRSLGVEVGQVASSLFSSLKNLDPGAGLGDPKLLGFIHGELPQDELQTMAERIESDPVLRKEFEGWLSLSDDLEHLMSRPQPETADTEVPLPNTASGARNGPNIKYKMFIGGAMACAAITGLFVTMIWRPSRIQPPKPAADLARAALDQKSASPPDHTEETSVAPSTSSVQKMEIIPNKLKVSDNLNSKRVLLALRQRIDGKPTCIPAGTHPKFIRSIIRVSPSGVVTRVDAEPRNSAFSQCLARQLDGRTAQFKPSNKRRAEISIALRNADEQ